MENVKRIISVVFILAVLFSTSTLVFAQKKKGGANSKTEKVDKAMLEAKKKNLLSQIELTDKLLKETRRTKTLSLTQLVALNKKIEIRESLINGIAEEIFSLDKEIADNNSLALQQDKEIEQLKSDYARMVIFAYRNQDAYQRMMFIFSAKNFNTAYLRMRYLQQIGWGRKLQAEKIKARQKELNENIIALEEQKTAKKILLGSNEMENNQLVIEKSDKDKTFHRLQEKEVALKGDLEKKQREKIAINKAIQDLIAAELARATAKVNEPIIPKKTPVEKVPALTPESQSLGNSFAGNKGALPWPVAQGTIIARFGKQPHPVLKEVFVNNNGIDIATTGVTSARAVFDGEVTGVTNIPGSGWLVIVRHGDYLTVYAKLEETYVKQGDKVKTKQNIGKISEDMDEGQRLLHFEVWQSGIGKTNPETWILNGGR